MLVDCDTCIVRGTACSECVIGVLLRRPPAGAPMDLDAAEAAAIDCLAGAGMVPPLRLVPMVRAEAFHPAAGSDTPQRVSRRTAAAARARPVRSHETPGNRRSEGIA